MKAKMELSLERPSVGRAADSSDARRFSKKRMHTPAMRTAICFLLLALNALPGTHTVSAVRAGYLLTHYGQKRPRDAGRPLELKSGVVVDGLHIGMFRGGTLAGRISDQQGDQARGVTVEAIELRYINGVRIPVAAANSISNDIGEF